MPILLEPKLGMRKRLSVELGQVLYWKSQSRVRLVTYLTCRSVEPFNNAVCFFCQKGETKKQGLIKLTTDIAGMKLRKAVEKSQNEVFRVRISTAINPDDAHAIDVRYHNNCYVKHVTNVLRAESQSSSKSKTVE